MLYKRYEKFAKSLVEEGVFSKEDVKVLIEKLNSITQLREFLVQEGYITIPKFMKLYAESFGLEYVDLSKLNISQMTVRLLDQDTCLRHKIVPIDNNSSSITIAVSDISNLKGFQEVRDKLSTHVNKVVSLEEDIIELISSASNQEVVDNVSEDMKSFNETIYGEMDDDDLENLEAEDSPVVDLVNKILTQSVNLGVSDIHIEPESNILRIRIRRDGALEHFMELPLNVLDALTSRIKILSNLQIDEKRIPQDGKISYGVNGRQVDLRVSILPTTNGEKTVLRILDGSSLIQPYSELGFSKDEEEKMNRLAKNTNGIILVTGPTGSGKSTTLYSTLNILKDMETNLGTVEDPVEFNIDGINQTQVNEKAGLTFAAALRSFLRQDPDKLMVGEIRDTETAKIAVRASITGHLVLSTLHTNSTVATVDRLVDMGIEHSLVATSVKGIIAQRLARRVCSHCGESYKPSEGELETLDLKGINPDELTFRRGVGCRKCNHTGTSGRIAVFEILMMDEDIKEAILREATTQELARIMKEKGMHTLTDSAQVQLIKGLIPHSEYLKILYGV